MDRKMNIAKIYVILGSVFFGTAGSAGVFIDAKINPIAIGAFRLAIGGVVLLIVVLIKGLLPELLSMKRKNLFYAALGMAMYQVFFFSAVVRTGVALASMLAIGSAPVFSGCIDVLTKGKISRNWIIATAVSITGCIMLFAEQLTFQIELVGMLLALGAGASYTMYAIFSRKILKKTTRVVSNAAIFLVSALMVSPAFFIFDLSGLSSVQNISAVLYLGIFTAALAYTLLTKGLKKLSVSQTIALTLAEPLTAALFGIILFKEKMEFFSYIGILILFLGLVMNSWPEKPAKSDQSIA